MIKWFFVIAGLLVACGLFFTMKYGIAPRAIPLIKATEVDSLEQAGVLVYRRLRQEIRSENTLIAGSLPGIPEYEKFWQGFVLGTQSDGAVISEIVTVSGMMLFREAAVIPILNETMTNAIQLALNGDKSKRQLYYLPTSSMTHLNLNSLSSQMDNKKKSKISIALHDFVATKDQITEDCPAVEEDSLLKKLNCLAVKVLQDNYRRKIDPKKKYVTLYKFGRFDYIAFWYDPALHTHQN